MSKYKVLIFVVAILSSLIHANQAMSAEGQKYCLNQGWTTDENDCWYHSLSENKYYTVNRKGTWGGNWDRTMKLFDGSDIIVEKGRICPAYSDGSREGSCSFRVGQLLSNGYRLRAVD